MSSATVITQAKDVPHHTYKEEQNNNVCDFFIPSLHCHPPFKGQHHDKEVLDGVLVLVLMVAVRPWLFGFCLSLSESVDGDIIT